MALIPALFECRARQMCVRQRKHTSADVYTRESQHQRYYEEPHKPVDRGDCQGSLYTQADREYDRVTAHELRALSASWAYNCQVALPAWRPVNSVLGVIWGLPEFVSMRHGLYRWWHADTGSSGGHTTSSGSRTSSPSSITYTICMQPLLWRS